VDVPTTVGKDSYRILVDPDNNDRIIAHLLNRPDINVTREIFNIEEPNNRVKGEFVSTAGRVNIFYNGTDIIVQRG